MKLRVAIAQIEMRWTTHENLAAMRSAIEIAHRSGAQLCAFSELAVTGFHRQIARESTPEIVAPAMETLRLDAARLSLALAIGAPSFCDGAILDSHLLINERGNIAAVISKRGLTDAEATFFARGDARPIGMLQGRRCSAVICREVCDLESVKAELPAHHTDLIFVPGALRGDPDDEIVDPPEYVRDIQRLAATTHAHVIQTNWPNALNRPEESVDGGGSTVAGPLGQVLFRLPMRAAGIAVFDLGCDHFEWIPEPSHHFDSAP